MSDFCVQEASVIVSADEDEGIFIIRSPYLSEEELLKRKYISKARALDHGYFIVEPKEDWDWQNVLDSVSRLAFHLQQGAEFSELARLMVGGSVAEDKPSAPMENSRWFRMFCIKHWFRTFKLYRLPVLSITVYQDRPWTHVIMSYGGGPEKNGWSKANWPDKWNEERGIKIAISDAADKLFNEVLSYSQKQEIWEVAKEA